MVDINGKNYSDIIKIKGTDKKIDLTKLEGLQRTEQNKAIFDMVDHNKDGVIDRKEATALQGNLITASNGNGKLSEREANKLYGKDKNAFDAINSLADQQAAYEAGKDYKETNGDTINVYSKGSSYSTIENGEIVRHQQKGIQYSQQIDDKGTVTTTTDDGIREIQYKDGSRQRINPDGTVISYDKNGNKTSVIKDGNTTTFPDANRSVTTNKDGQITKTVTVDNDNIISADYEYKDGKTIMRINVEDKDGNTQLAKISVQEKKDGHNIDTTYATEEDMANGKPSEIITDGHNETLRTVTNYTYNQDGTYSTETTDSAGKKTVKNFNADGTEIKEAPKPEAPTTHPVEKGESITKIVTDALKQQGIENPTPEQLKEAKKEFLEMNKDLVKTYKGVKKEWHGNKFFYPGDVVKIPNFKGEQKVEEAPAQEVETTPAQETPAQKPKVENDTTPQETVPAQENNGTSSELTEEIIKNGDKDNSQTLDKGEYEQFIINTLGLEVTDANREKIQGLLDSSFQQLDSVSNDGKVTKEELDKSAADVFEQLGNSIDDIEQAEFDQELSEIDNQATPQEVPKAPEAPKKAPDNQNKKLTNEQINANIDNLKPGESFTYTLTTSANWGSGSNKETKPITWRKNEDGTLTQTVPEFVHNSGGRTKINKFSTTYAADKKTIISQDQQPMGLRYINEAISTKHFENGKPTHLSTDISNLDKVLIKDSFGNPSATRLMSSLERQSAKTQAKFSSQEIKNSDGETVVTFKDGKFFNAKGKEISYDKAHKIVSKLNEDNKLGSLIQTLKPEE